MRVVAVEGIVKMKASSAETRILGEVESLFASTWDSTLPDVSSTATATVTNTSSSHTFGADDVFG